jgi:hypothetical protein
MTIPSQHNSHQKVTKMAAKSRSRKEDFFTSRHGSYIHLLEEDGNRTAKNPPPPVQSLNQWNDRVSRKGTTHKHPRKVSKTSQNMPETASRAKETRTPARDRPSKSNHNQGSSPKAVSAVFEPIQEYDLALTRADTFETSNQSAVNKNDPKLYSTPKQKKIRGFEVNPSFSEVSQISEDSGLESYLDKTKASPRRFRMAEEEGSYKSGTKKKRKGRKSHKVVSELPSTSSKTSPRSTLSWKNEIATTVSASSSELSGYSSSHSTECTREDDEYSFDDRIDNKLVIWCSSCILGD